MGVFEIGSPLTTCWDLRYATRILPEAGKLRCEAILGGEKKFKNQTVKCKIVELLRRDFFGCEFYWLR